MKMRLRRLTEDAPRSRSLCFGDELEERADHPLSVEQQVEGDEQHTDQRGHTVDQRSAV